MPPTKLPGPAVIAKWMTVPSGAFTEPVPSLTFTCPVSVWFVPAGFVAVAGVIWMFASTTFSGSHAPSDALYTPAFPR